MRLRSFGLASAAMLCAVACGKEVAAPPAPAAPAPPAGAAGVTWTKLGDVSFPSKAALAADPTYVDDPKVALKVGLDRTDWEAWYAVDADEPGRIAQLALVRPGARPEGAAGDVFGGAFDLVGVDSGQAGFFDPAHAGKDDEAVEPFADLSTKEPLGRWYLMCCARTLTKPGVGLVPFGVVSSSGMGDGGYEVFIRRDAAKAIEVVRIDFLPDDEDDEAK